MIRVIGFDPAITEMGIVVVDYDPDSKTVLVLHTESVKGASLLRHYKQMRKEFEKSFCIQTAYYHYILALYRQWLPDEVVSEGGFYGKFVAALISITLVNNVIRMTSRDYHAKDIHIVAPTETKSLIVGKPRADKDEIRAGVLSNPHIKFSPKILNFDFLTEHEYDGIGHAATWCLKHHSEQKK